MDSSKETRPTVCFRELVARFQRGRRESLWAVLIYHENGVQERGHLSALDNPGHFFTLSLTDRQALKRAMAAWEHLADGPALSRRTDGLVIMPTLHGYVITTVEQAAALDDRHDDQLYVEITVLPLERSHIPERADWQTIRTMMPAATPA